MRRSGWGLVLAALLGTSGCILILPTPARDPGHRRDLYRKGSGEVTLRVGTTTREEALLALGEPDAHSPDGRAFTYASGSIYLVIIVAGQGGGAAGECGSHRRLELRFSPEGLLERVAVSSEVFMRDL